MVRRIRDEISSPALRKRLIDEVEHGDDLSNPEAAKVYQLDREPGVGSFIKQISISPHAQYRMDLRSVTVENIRDALAAFNGRLDPKQMNAREYNQLTTKLMYGDEIRFTANRLTVVFAMKGSVAMIVTTFWDGVSDPRMPPRGCPI